MQAEAFVQAVGGDAPTRPEVRAMLVAGWRDIIARWPEAQVETAFAARAAACVGACDGDLARVHLEDLYLAWWAGGGSAAGIAAFEQAFAQDLAHLLARFHRLPADELRQQLRIHLFVSTPARAAKIHAYQGLGFLQNWLRVTAARLFVDLARAQSGARREIEDDEALLGLPAADDPARGHLRAQLQAIVKPAFATAAASLPARARTYLRHVYVDGLTLEQIAALHDVHRATVARALAQGREHLWSATRAAVTRALAVAPDELASVLKHLDSQFELSLARVLATAAAPDALSVRTADKP